MCQIVKWLFLEFASEVYFLFSCVCGRERSEVLNRAAVSNFL